MLLQNKLPQNRIWFYGSFPKISLKDFIARSKVDPLQINVETYERYQLEDFFLQNYKNVCDHERQKKSTLFQTL